MNHFLPLLRKTKTLYKFYPLRSISSYPTNPPGSELFLNATNRRWLYNDDIHMAIRRLDFDIEALGRIGAIASGSSECNEMALIGEGTFNRIFRLSFDTGKNLIARIPFPNAGPRSLLTRSEVATMDLVRTRLGASVPKVLAWDASENNEVGCEYILMEECVGDVLAKRLDAVSDSSPYVFDIAKLLGQLSAIPFSQYGSIYYKEDVDAMLQSRPLYAEGQQPDKCSERFRIGASVDRRFYRGERARMDIDRGPWTDIHSYIKAAVDCEVKWLKTHSHSQSAQNQLGAQHTADQHISLLNRWLSLAPAVLPSPEHCTATISHPDLHAANIFINDSMSVTAIIDWQGATIRPLFETPMPKFVDIETSNLVHSTLSAINLDQPVLPHNFDKLSDEQKLEARAEITQIASKRRFLELISHSQPALGASLRLPQMELLRRGIYYSSYSWSDGLPLLEQTLMLLTAAYGDYIPVKPEYPSLASFSEEEVKRHEEEFKEIIHAEEWLDAHVTTLLKMRGLTIYQDGAVDEAIFEEARKMVDEHFVKFYTTIERDRGKERADRFRRHWPLREGKFVHSMESCV